jgi:sugar lactone lactonase YvrE
MTRSTLLSRAAESSHRLGKRLRDILLLVAIAPTSLFCQTTGGKVVLGSAPARTSLNSLLNIYGPGVLAVDASGHTYVAVRDGVFKIDSSGFNTRVAGAERNWHFSGDGGPAIQAGINPHGLAIDAAGDLYIADTGNNRIRKLAAATGVITTVAGNGARGSSGDGGPAIGAQLDSPTGVAVDIEGNLYLTEGTTDGNFRVRRVAAATGVITTVAGNGLLGYSGDGGPATVAQFSSLGGLATDRAGNLYIADNFNNRIRMLSAATGIVTTVAGNGIAGLSGDGGPALDAQLNNPLAVAVNAAGDLLIADSGNFRIRKVAAATATISTISNSGVVYRDRQHAYPCALAVDAAGDVYVADSGISRIRKLAAASAASRIPPLVESTASTSGFKINVTYDNTVPATAQTAFNRVISTYESIFTTNITVNIDVTFGNTDLGESVSEQQGFSYSAWRAAMIANANANPGNTCATAAAASLPANDPIGNRTVFLNTANARALGLTANTAVDSTITFSNSVTFEYNGVAVSGEADFLDVAAHELNEALGIGSALTGLADNAPIPTGDYFPEDYFRYSAAGTRAITTTPSAIVYFSYDGGHTNVAQFNQAFTAQGASGLDRNDWVYGNFGCPAATVYVQNALQCLGQAVVIGSGPEITVLSALGYDSSIPQTITFGSLSNVTFGVAPFTISATASSGLPVSFTSTTATICAVSGSTVTIIEPGTCSITATQAGNATYAAAAPIVQSFTVSSALAPGGINPASGSGTTQTFTFTFSDSAGYANLAVVDILINNFLDGQQACYIALAPASASSGYLYLVDDAGDGGYANGSPLLLPSSSSLHNSQCTVNGTGSSVSGSGNTLTLKLAITFTSAFAGNKIVYMAARSNTQNSGWQALGTWDVPGATPPGPGVNGVSPARSSGTGQTYTFTFTDTNGYTDLSVLDILTNSFLDGINACYVAYVPTGASTGYLYLVDDAGDGGYAPGSPILLSSGATLQNNQCSISAAGSSASASSNTLNLNLAITFKPAFAGNQVFYLAARNNSTGNSGWQAAGSVTVP